MSLIHVCPLCELEPILRTTRAQWLISLSGPGKTQYPAAQLVGGHLALEFNDIGHPQPGLVPPGADHVRKMLDFLDRWNDSADLVIQCWMGISRSTAAAAIAMAWCNPQADMGKLAQNLRDRSPMATPNPRMIALADDMLNFDGRLRDAIHSIGRGVDASLGKPFTLETGP